MKKYLLDTNICIFYLKGKYDLSERFDQVGFENCCISEITFAELLYGAECSNNVVKNTQTINDFAKTITIVPIYGALSIYAREKFLLRTAGRMIDDFDLLIGATAIANNMVLVTDNEKHLNRLSMLKMENWIKR
jgi:tRNA(fMet)-specific endonuclease VapC